MKQQKREEWRMAENPKSINEPTRWTDSEDEEEPEVMR